MLIVLSQADPQVHLLQSVIILAVVGCVSNLMAFAGAHFRIMNVSILVRASLRSGGVWFEVPREWRARVAIRLVLHGEAVARQAGWG